MSQPACAFELSGNPVAKGRPRFGKGRVYTPTKTRDYQHDLAWAAKLAMGRRKPLQYAVALRVYAYQRNPMAKPDADNILKIVADALNGVCFTDDAQIIDARVAKLTGEPRVQVEVWEVCEFKKNFPAAHMIASAWP